MLEQYNESCPVSFYPFFFSLQVFLIWLFAIYLATLVHLSARTQEAVSLQ